MRWYNDLAIRTSQSGWLFINTVIVFAGALIFVFFNLNIPFVEIVGAQMFDFQNDLTTGQIFIQLEQYNDSARAIYFAFLFVDFYFPFFAGLFLAATAAFSLRHLSPTRYESIRTRQLFAVFLIPTLCDWGENIFALTVVNAWPDQLNWAASALVLCKQGKLASMMFFNGLVGLLLVLATLKWLGKQAGIVQ